MNKREKIEIETTEGVAAFRCPKMSEFESFIEASDQMDKVGDIASIKAVRQIMQGWLLSGTIDVEPWEFNSLRYKLHIECMIPPEKKSS